MARKGMSVSLKPVHRQIAQTTAQLRKMLVKADKRTKAKVKKAIRTLQKMARVLGPVCRPGGFNIIGG